MNFAVPKGRPEKIEHKNVTIRYAGKRTIVLFIFTIITAVSFHNFLHLPAVMGMMLGLGYLQVLSFFHTSLRNA